MPLELPPEIAASIPAEHLSHEAIQRYNSPADLIKGHIEQREFISRSIALPNGEKPEEMEKWRGEQNAKLKDRGFAIAPLKDLRSPAPATPDDYKFDFGDKIKPEDIAADETFKKFKAFAHKRGFSQDEAAEMVKWFAEEGAPEIAKKFAPPEVDFVHGDAVKDLMGEVFKEKSTQVLDEYRRNVDMLSMTIPELKDALNEGVAPFGEKWTMIGDHPAIVKLVNMVAEMTRQDFGGSVNGAVQLNKDGAAAKAEADDIMGNKENPRYNKYWGGDKEVVAYVNALYEKAFPGDVTV